MEPALSEASDGVIAVPSPEPTTNTAEPKAQIRKILKSTKILAEKGRWRKIILITSASDHATSPAIIGERLHAAIELSDKEDLARCGQIIRGIDDLTARVKLAAMLLNSRHYAEAALIIESLPSDYYSVQAARVTKRIATLTGKPTPPRQLEEVRSAGELHRAGSYRHPGDNKDFNLPDADMKMIGLDGFGEDFQGHVRQLWARTEIRLERQPFPFVNEFRDVFIDKNGAIWTAEGRDIKSARQMQGRITDPTQVPNFDEAYTCLGGSAGYYEWLIDRLSKLSWRLAPDAPNCPILVREKHHKLALDSLGALSVPSDKIVLVEGTVYCRKLYFGHTSAAALTRDVAFQYSYGRLIELAAEKRDVSLPRRFYISRRDTTRRAMRDESQFEAEMTALGIVPVVLSQLNLLQKVDLFQNAELVVGAHGAGLSHLVFAKPGLQVIEIMPASKHRIMEMGIRVCFSAIARIRGLNYTMILTNMDPKTGMWSGSDQLIQAIAASARPA